MTNRGRLGRWLMISVIVALLAHTLGFRGDPVECTRIGNPKGARGPSGVTCIRKFEIVCDDPFSEDGQPGAARELGVPGPKGASAGDGSPPGFVCDTDKFGQPGPPGDDACKRVPTIACPDWP
ncbi:collagen alpha-1(XXIII) chain-like [Watersipora subatra]|uniref:collagen alpha-1(XXIII) chain-like n=1 Tax=Watersipora subatra TaxID=2589382 RepID=UPI00355B67BD